MFVSLFEAIQSNQKTKKDRTFIFEITSKSEIQWSSLSISVQHNFSGANMLTILRMCQF